MADADECSAAAALGHELPADKGDTASGLAALQEAFQVGVRDLSRLLQLRVHDLAFRPVLPTAARAGSQVMPTVSR